MCVVCVCVCLICKERMKTYFPLDLKKLISFNVDLI